MDILVTMPEGLRDDFFAEQHHDRLAALGGVAYNDTDEQLSERDLRERIPGVDAVVTGWGSPAFDEGVLEAADELDVVVHTGGSVAGYATEALYDAGVAVCSANRVMAKFVAEQVLGHLLAAKRRLVAADREMRDGGYPREQGVTTLYGAEIGLIGLGTVGRHLLLLLAPFDATVQVYDPYVSPAAVAEYGFVEQADLETALDSEIVSVHAARTPETREMLGAEEFAAIPDGALFVNTARAELTVREALTEELRSGRIEAALDVFHEEPLPEDSPLRDLENVQLTPHTGGPQVREPFTDAMIGELERLDEGRPLQHRIPREQWQTMTR
jgi:phosphoglycerate dehydrogenase-like enzyme